MDRAVDVRESARLLAPQRGGQDDVREFAGLGEEGVLTTTNRPAFCRIVRTRAAQATTRRGWCRSSRGTGSSLLGVAEDLHRVGRRCPVRDLQRLHVPELGQFVRYEQGCPSCERRQGRRLRRSRACSARSAGHSSGKAAHPAGRSFRAEVDVVDLHGRRGRLVRLVHALQTGGDEPLGIADQPRSGADVVRGDTADLRRALRRVALDRLRSRSKPTVWALTKSTSIRPLAISSCSIALSNTRFVPLLIGR